ncbi:HAD family phosphatase [Sphingomonas gilva]|uniref:HAD family phosphatase n=1 Tax=Sphingomonas gilva TaxID=2305907 RepID=A0A396RMM4_9SPHN|nr:HAD family phosphatase [Sphingomonas gilva]RHW17684.1 HAD family phosphatase [Sphingomonas gilva]
MKPNAIIFDFDGVLLESEYAGNLHLAETLTSLGHPVSTEEAMARFMGLAGPDFHAAIERHIGGPIPEAFHDSRRAEDARVAADGLEAVAGAIAFVRALPADLPRAVASSSSIAWIDRHLRHLGLREAFGEHIYSGREHVARGKPAPDIYLHAAQQLGVPIEDTLIIEDSPVGVTGAVASGAMVVGLCAGRHCPPDHAAVLRAKGVEHIARGFDEIAAMIGLTLPV